MSITFPTSLDSFTTQVGTSKLSSPDHTSVHNDLSDVIEALEAKVGVGSGTPTANNFLVGSGNGTSLWANSSLLLNSPKIATALLDTNSNEILIVSPTTSAVNEITVYNAAQNGKPTLAASGADANINIGLSSKGTSGKVVLGSDTTAGVALQANQPIMDNSYNELIKFTKTISAVNEITIANAAENNPPVISATGGDTNIHLQLSAKGTSGAVITTYPVGIGTISPHAEAILELTSTTKALILPRLSTTQRNAISSPTSGMLIYNTTSNKLNFYASTAWEAITSG